jgi:hypothetical protein
MRSSDIAGLLCSVRFSRRKAADNVTPVFAKSCRIRSDLETAPASAGAAQQAINKKATAEKVPTVALLKNGVQAPVEKAVMRRPHPGIVAKIESRDGGHTIVFSRSRLSAFFFGVRLAWLSPFPLGEIEVSISLHPSAQSVATCDN